MSLPLRLVEGCESARVQDQHQRHPVPHVVQPDLLAADGLMGQDTAQYPSIPAEALSGPQSILGVDGKVLAKVAHRAAPLTPHHVR